MAMHPFIEVKLVLTDFLLGSNIKMVAALASSPSTDIFGFRKFEAHSVHYIKYELQRVLSQDADCNDAYLLTIPSCCQV